MTKDTTATDSDAALRARLSAEGGTRHRLPDGGVVHVEQRADVEHRVLGVVVVVPVDRQLV